jgi:hypothetical protein
VAKFIETFDKLDPAKWALWRGAGTLNIGEINVNSNFNNKSFKSKIIVDHNPIVFSYWYPKYQ